MIFALQIISHTSWHEVMYLKHRFTTIKHRDHRLYLLSFVDD